MTTLIFHGSRGLTLGVELELQLINPKNHALMAKAKDFIRNISSSRYSELIKPEGTQGMIEINSSVQKSVQGLSKELLTIGNYLGKQGEKLGVEICGGGTHPFQRWDVNKIFPSKRFKNLSWNYRYLFKRFTVFALHFHIGCENGDDALYLIHALSRYVPHFLTLSASSPFYQGADTGFHTSRANVASAFPFSGHIPYLTSWESFSDYYFKLKRLKMISSMKDMYWDIRPKPTFGTIEVRVCDMPLTIHRAIAIVAYAQTLARYLLKERPLKINEDLYLLYNYNRFQACRYGFEGDLIDPVTLKRQSIQDDILATLKKIKSHAAILNTENYLKEIHLLALRKENDATWLKKTFAKKESFEKLIQNQSQIWRKQF